MTGVQTCALPILLYAGGLYGSRTLAPVLDAFAALRDRGQLTPDRLTLHYMGRSADAARAQTAARGLEAFVTIEGVRPNRESLAASLGAACNLTLVGEDHVRQIPAKVFEHVAACRPMLVIGPRGSDTEALLEPIPWARCVLHDDAPAVYMANLPLWLDHGDAKRLQRELVDLVRRYDGRNGSTSYMFTLGLTPSREP